MVLSRQAQQKIVLTRGDLTIEITLVDIRWSKKGDKARIGIEAPDDVRIDREEVHLARQRGEVKGAE